MTREERTKLIKHLKYNRSIGADYLITDKDVDEIIKALEQEHCENVPDINDGNIYECSCGYGWDQSKVVRHHFCPNCGRAVDNLIKTELNRVKTELEPCEDAVSRQAVLENAINVPIAKIVTEDKVICRKVIFADDIEKLPSVTPQQMGYWEWNQYDANPKIGNFHCSLCHSIGRTYFDYCPYCGAKMSEIQTGAESEG